MAAPGRAVTLFCPCSRPLAVCVTYYALLVPLSVFLHDELRDTLGLSSITRNSFRKVAIDTWGLASFRKVAISGTLGERLPVGLAVYATWLLAWRLWHIRRAYVLYEYCWLCNFTIVASGIAIATSRPWLALAYCSVVAVDQFLWYVDLAYYLSVTCSTSFSQRRDCHDDRPAQKRFLVGVCQYVFDDQTSWTTRITCTHHLWTIPVVIWQLVNDENLLALLHQDVSQQSFWDAWHFLSLLSFTFMTLHVALSRVLIPLRDAETGKYLNANLGHDLWKDVTISWLQISDPNAVKYLSRLLLRWQVLNMTFGFVIVSFVQQATTRIR